MSACHKPAAVVGHCIACGESVCAFCEMSIDVDTPDGRLHAEPVCAGCAFAAEDGDPVARDLLSKATGLAL